MHVISDEPAATPSTSVRLIEIEWSAKLKVACLASVTHPMNLH